MMDDTPPPPGVKWDEARAWLEERAGRIFIRIVRDGRGVNVALAELDGEERAFHMGRLVERLVFGHQVIVLREA